MCDTSILTFGYVEFISDIILNIPGHLDLQMTRSKSFSHKVSLGCNLTIFSHVNICNLSKSTNYHSFLILHSE